VITAGPPESSPQPPPIHLLWHLWPRQATHFPFKPFRYSCLSQPCNSISILNFPSLLPVTRSLGRGGVAPPFSTHNSPFLQYPYALQRLTTLARDSWGDPTFQHLIAGFPEATRPDAATLLAHVEDLTRRDVKAVYLKQLQGMLLLHFCVFVEPSASGILHPIFRSLPVHSGTLRVIPCPNSPEPRDAFAITLVKIGRLRSVRLCNSCRMLPAIEAPLLIYAWLCRAARVTPRSEYIHYRLLLHMRLSQLYQYTYIVLFHFHYSNRSLHR